MKNIFQTGILFLVFTVELFSQELNLSSLTLSQDLKQSANAVVRLDETVITITDNDKMTIQKKRIVTVLNATGNRNTHAVIGYDKNRKIISLKATIYDAFGKKIKKISESKFTDIAASDNNTLASDDRIKYLEYTPNHYPYTILIEYETKSNTTSYIRNWEPIEGFHVGIEKSVFTIINPNGFVLNTKEKNFDNYTIEKNTSQHKISYQIQNIHPINYEPYAPDNSKIFPCVLFGLNEFSVYGISGTATNWKEFGKWEYDVLIKEKNNLSNETIQKIQSLTASITDTIEKARFVYEYVQKKTRYISVQYGIGGLSPAYSAEVDALGYGDCKGLTNYTKSLLEAVGITSYYTEIYGQRNKTSIEKDFHSMQGNHIVLNIPYKGQDIWLECTSQTQPFGYLGSFTDDRDALVITPEGGIIKHTPIFMNEQNLQKTNAAIRIDSNGHIKSTLEIETKGSQYETHHYIEEYDSKEVADYYKSNYWKTLNNISIENYSFENDKKNIRFTEKLHVNINNYGVFAGTDLLVTTNIFNKFKKLPPKLRSRKLPIEIQRGFQDIDTFTYTLPEIYSVSYLPSEKTIETEFGTYKVVFKKIDDNHFEYHRELLIKAGTYAPETYSDYRTFLKSITKYDNLRVAFSKKQL